MGNTSTWIAVIDHDAATREALVTLLGTMEWKALSFSSGYLFIDSLRFTQPDCIILDLHMPYMSGFTIMSKLGQLAKKIPVIVLTRHELTEDFKQACLSSAVAILQKPIDEQALNTAIKKALNKKLASFSASRLAI
ncbi:hypothetical protein UNDYM_4444 [Undibacterium sp. YM2]|uniref:response regulator transcription factor n=1 Tax=Undibacterium sp. YM2 TaxID=2058625 RepID=UPI001331FB84|nr:response regulator [Undibacterium sp. YM2]BBB68697.1 hypothetical protein UNDYM_4444 [Undibacterium sp. YM2]